MGPREITIPELSPELIRCAMPRGQPDTVCRLWQLKPNETLTYYVGRLDEDISRSVRAPKYRELLVNIRDTALELQRMHRIVLSQSEVRVKECRHSKRHKTNSVAVYVYNATGVKLS